MLLIPNIRMSLITEKYKHFEENKKAQIVILITIYSQFNKNSNISKLFFD